MSMRSSRQRYGRKYLTTALAVYPHEEPGIGPNKYNFDDDVLYEIRVATGRCRGRANDLRVSVPVHDHVQEPQHDPAVVPRGDRQRWRRLAESVQRYTVDKVDWRTGRRRDSDRASFHPTTRGTPRRNTTATTTASSPPRTASRTRRALDPYTAQTIAELEMAMWRLPASGTMGSTPTFRPYSIC